MADLDVSTLTSYASSLLSNAKSNAVANETKSSINSVGKNSSDDELLGACKQFESYLWEQILKEVDKTTNLFGTGAEGSYAANMMNTFSDTFVQAFSDKLTSAGGDNSLAQTLYEQLKRNYASVTPEEIDVAKLSEQMAESGTITENIEE